MARRGFIIAAILFGLLLGQAVIFSLRTPSHNDLASRLYLTEVLAVVATLAAGLVGLSGIASLRRQSVQLAKAIAESSKKLTGDGIRSDDPDLQSLVESLNNVFTAAKDSVSKASIQAKELEIRLKIAHAERQHAEAILYSISDAVLVTDSFDELVLANESAARTLEFELAAAARSPVQKLLKDEKLIGLIREMRQSNCNTERRIVEHAIGTPTGNRTFKVTLACVADRTDSNESLPSGVVAVLHDVTKEKEVAQMKNDFVSNVSHELRTPLASIKAYVEMLIDGEADDDRTKREFYEVIQNEANRLSRLIDDILNISRIESGVVKVNKQPQSLGVIIKEAVEVITPQAKQKNIAVNEGMTPIFYQTLADRDMLYQGLLNLLSNAVKYTPEGGRIDVHSSVDEVKRTVVVRISDTGVGIPAKDLPYVFDKFYRSEANNRMAKGTGLGLSLVKQIIETVHAGTVFVESTVGKGSCFGFELKLID
jgi:two-component system phosphate regulon sensor histidine kinase PhoR